MYPDILGHVDTGVMVLSGDTIIQDQYTSHLLRGAIAQTALEDSCLHQHEEQKYLYRYPLVQYHWNKNQGILVGINQGIESISQLSLSGQSFDLGNNKWQIKEVDFFMSRQEVFIAPILQRYYFQSPWIAFNQENYHKYKEMNRKEKIAERDRMIVANLLTTLKSLNIFIPVTVYAAFTLHKTVPCRYKNGELMGFMGDVLTNLVFPEYIGIGKAVSHGYGWLVRETFEN